MARMTPLALAALALLTFSGCSQNFRSFYDTPVAAEVSQTWRLSDVVVTVPETLTVSERKGVLPRADIVWREGPNGNRREQVAEILEEATRMGAVGMSGAVPVRIELVVERFHALTFEAERLNVESGVHDIKFVATVTDPATGAILSGPERIEASLPALAGVAMIEARAAGETQRSQITAHVAKVMAGWLGVGPDARADFTRLGG